MICDQLTNQLASDPTIQGQPFAPLKVARDPMSLRGDGNLRMSIHDALKERGTRSWATDDEQVGVWTNWIGHRQETPLPRRQERRLANGTRRRSGHWIASARPACRTQAPVHFQGKGSDRHGPLVPGHG